MLKILRKE